MYDMNIKKIHQLIDGLHLVLVVVVVASDSLIQSGSCSISRFKNVAAFFWFISEAFYCKVCGVCRTAEEVRRVVGGLEAEGALVGDCLV